MSSSGTTAAPCTEGPASTTPPSAASSCGPPRWTCPWCPPDATHPHRPRDRARAGRGRMAVALAAALGTPARRHIDPPRELQLPLSADDLAHRVDRAEPDPV